MTTRSGWSSLVVGWLLVLGLSLPYRSFGAEVEIGPLKLTFGPARQSDIVRIRNYGSEKIVLQIRVYRWDQPEGGADAYAETEDILFFPRIFEVGTGEEKIVRVAARNPVVERERSYRLYVEQLPGEPLLQRIGIKTLLRMGIPVFVAPAEAKAGGAIEPPSFDGAEASFRLRNSGNAHLLARKIHVSAHDASGAEVFSTHQDGWYLLAGGSAPVRTTLTPGACASARRFDVKVETTAEPLEESFPVSPRSCR